MKEELSAVSRQEQHKLADLVAGYLRLITGKNKKFALIVYDVMEEEDQQYDLETSFITILQARPEQLIKSFSYIIRAVEELRDAESENGNNPKH